MFIGMIYGDQFSLISLFEGRWLEPVGRLLNRAWDQIAEALDLMLQFLERHSSWVLATVSGSIGLSIVAFVMFSGMADDAAATHRDLTAPLFAGSVIDDVPEVTSTQRPRDIVLTSAAFDESQYVHQQPGAEYLVFNRPEFDAPLVMRQRTQRVFDDLPDPNEERFESLERPVLDVSFKRREIRSLHFEDDTSTMSVGRLIDSDSRQLAQVISNALRGLPRDDWRLTYRDSIRPGRFGEDRTNGDRFALPETTIPESTAAELRGLEDRSRVLLIGGDIVSESDLRIEKTVPQESTGQEITIAISVLNVGNNIVSGLLVREFLPRNTRVKAAEPQAAFRDDTITWLLNDLRPFDEQILRFTVLAEPLAAGLTRRTRFESVTEASAVTAVSTRTIARGVERRTQPVPAIVRRPELKMRIEEPLAPVRVGDVIEVNFIVQNVGTAPAEGVGLRVVLDQGLKHHRLTDDPLNREVVNGVRRLEPNETRTIVLRVTATRSGEFVSKAEMVFDGSALTRDIFRLVAQPKDDLLPGGPITR